ncbi:uncharacterized protein CLUP02_02334 [Colletotrichum lupini]|uniref:Uncharacterized protein n=1 Tax=Colletotrichum lupini TaxID=145971 RepID=A0A9Q8SEN4_9PEZI|nr:uncharacterized protein CLUP02_02334 [Colletotrichum lupini]UQC75678.1 hypothetical protein CLUP02_02334 [Colletotrichum lupini]
MAWIPVPTTSICPAPKRRGEKVGVLMVAIVWRPSCKSPSTLAKLFLKSKLLRYLRKAFQPRLACVPPCLLTLPRMFHGHENIARTLLLASIPRWVSTATQTSDSPARQHLPSQASPPACLSHKVPVTILPTSERSRRLSDVSSLHVYLPEVIPDPREWQNYLAMQWKLRKSYPSSLHARRFWPVPTGINPPLVLNPPAFFQMHFLYSDFYPSTLLSSIIAASLTSLPSSDCGARSLPLSLIFNILRNITAMLWCMDTPFFPIFSRPGRTNFIFTILITNIHPSCTFVTTLIIPAPPQRNMSGSSYYQRPAPRYDVQSLTSPLAPCQTDPIACQLLSIFHVCKHRRAETRYTCQSNVIYYHKLLTLIRPDGQILGNGVRQVVANTTGWLFEGFARYPPSIAFHIVYHHSRNLDSPQNIYRPLTPRITTSHRHRPRPPQRPREAQKQKRASATALELLHLGSNQGSPD